jgi:hypothetical protein
MNPRASATGAVIPRYLLASQRDALEPFEFTDHPLDTGAIPFGRALSHPFSISANNVFCRKLLEKKDVPKSRSLQWAAMVLSAGVPALSFRY